MASHFFQESLFKMGTMVPITEELAKDHMLTTEVIEAYVIKDRDRPLDKVVQENRQLMLSLEEKEQSNVATPKEEEGQELQAKRQYPH